MVGRIIRDYGQLADAIRSRRLELGLSCVDLESATGIQYGYVTKIENWHMRYGRILGPQVLPLMLRGLSVGLVLVDDSAVAPRIEKLYEPRRAA